MPTITELQAHQALDVRRIDLDSGEVATVNLTDPQKGEVDWEGGVSWTIQSTVAGEVIDVSVEHSLAQEGDDHGLWTPDPESPFSEATEGKEHSRIQRLRFTNRGGSSVTVVVASESRYEVSAV